MALFSGGSTSQYYDQHPLLRKMDISYAETITINQTYWDEARLDTNMMAGYQDYGYSVYGNLPPSVTKFYFNKLRRIKDLIGGHQRRNRKSITTIPIENGDQMTADQFTKIIMWNAQKEGLLETISEAFDNSALISGLSLLQVWLDFRSDPVSGDLKYGVCHYNEFMMDPFFRKHDLSDCNFIWKRSYLTKREIMSYLPTYAEEIMSLSTRGGNDGKFPYMPEAYNFGTTTRYAYDEYWYRSYRQQRMIYDQETGESLEWTSDDEDALKRYLALYPQLTVDTQEVPTVNLGIVVDGKVMVDGPNPYGIDKYPFIPIFAYHYPQVSYFPWRIQGIVRQLRDAQYLYNRRKVIELDIIESQINSGWIYKENALVDPRSVFLSGQGRGIALKDDAQVSDIMKIPPASFDPAIVGLSEKLNEEMPEIAGISEEIMGFDNKDTLSGFHAQLKMSASTTGLQILFDRLDLSQKLLGRLIIDIIKSNFSPGKVKRIINEEPTPEFYNKAFGKYDIAIEDGLNTTTQRQLQMAQLLNLKEAGLPIPDEDILESSTIQNKSQLMESVKQRSQMQRQLQQLQMQAEIQALQSRAKRDEAKAIADTGLGIERQSRVEENKALAVERMSQAQRDRETGLLNLVKALKEIDDVDINQIQKLLTLADIVKSQETASFKDIQNDIQTSRIPEQSTLDLLQRDPGSDVNTL